MVKAWEGTPVSKDGQDLTEENEEKMPAGSTFYTQAHISSLCWYLEEIGKVVQ